jgi:Uma2 family endonuclease
MSSVVAAPSTPEVEIEYPESDGQPMADNSKQLFWILHLVANLEVLFGLREDVYVCGNMAWLPKERHSWVVQAPDVFVVFGRPKGHRTSYKQWEEGDVPLTVVFEILSPKNTPGEMAGKVLFYEQYGVEECYVFDPDSNELQAYVRATAALTPRHPRERFTSSRLGITFDRSDKAKDMVVRFPDGSPFLTALERERLRLDEKTRADAAEERANDQKRRADRLAELTRKVLAAQADAQELQELQTLLSPPPSP